jgi:hypothetical protein
MQDLPPRPLLLLGIAFQGPPTAGTNQQPLAHYSDSTMPTLQLIACEKATQRAASDALVWVRVAHKKWASIGR